MIGGLAFESVLVRPLVSRYPDEFGLERRVLRLLAWSALAAALTQALSVGTESVSMVWGAGTSLSDALTAGFNLAGFAKIAAALVIAGLFWSRPPVDGTRRSEACM